VVGDRRCWRVVRVPSVADEDARQLHRTWETLQGDRTRVINRLKAVLATQGVRLAITADFLEHVAATRVWDGSEIPSGARERLAHDWAQLQSIEEQLAAVKAARARLRIDPATATGRAVQALQGVRAIGAGGRLGLGDGDFWVARDPEWAATRRARRVGASAVSQRGDAARSRDYAGGQCARAAPDGATGLGLAAVAIRQCAGAVVSAPRCHRRIAAAAHWDRRVGAETSDRPVALRGSSYRA
jgi:transposase